MKIFASMMFAAALACSAVPAYADVPADPCQTGASKAGDACDDPVSGQPGACVTAASGMGTHCQAGATPNTSSSTTTGGGGGGSGGGGSGDSGGGCSVSGLGGMRMAPIMAALALAAGAMLRKRRAG